MKYFIGSDLSLKVKWNEKTIEIQLQGDTFGKLFQLLIEAMHKM